ncbi:MAG: hypothetical protein HY820_21445 [Acidobacteria bacterium]|nr:hypothetical protein [Acidobacteriota bacterium]
MKWKVKLGAEARPETVATRLVWAVGYFANEVYFLPLLQPLNMPRRLKRGQKFLDPDGSVRNARLKRELPGEKKNGHWAWREGPFTDTRELNGLRVLMALINNWDLKDENNGIVERTGLGGQRPERIYMVTDLGCSFGTAGPWWPGRMARGNLWSYAHSKFLRRVGPETIDLRTPGKPPWLFFLIKRPEYRHRRDLVWIGRDIPRADARWMGQILARLSSKQIRDAFRAASYSPRQVERFASLVEGRIAELNEL